jgi:hypothetical protein
MQLTEQLFAYAIPVSVEVIGKDPRTKAQLTGQEGIEDSLKERVSQLDRFYHWYNRFSSGRQTG